MFNFALMNLTTKQIAEEINGTLEGDSEIQISQLSKIEEGIKGSISFLANPKYTDYIYSTKASAVVVSNDFNPSEKISTISALISFLLQFKSLTFKANR